MYKNYFKIAWRNLTKYKMYSAIKIGGFSIGIATFLLILIFIKDELSYDKNYEHGDRIFRVISVHNDPSDFGMGTAFPAQIGQDLRDNFPELEKVGRLIPYDWFNAGNNQFRAEDNLQSNY
jgi:putative ABC transport system permease protein